jgi:hypothetical protein
MSIDPKNPDTRDVGDPSNNYTVPQNQPAGMRIPEFIFRQLISWSIQQVRNNVDMPKNNLVDELFAMAGADVIKQIKDWLRGHANLFIDTSWPKDDATLPAIVIENQGEQEDTSNALLGDVAGMMSYGRFGGAETSRMHFAVPEQHVTNIYIATTDDRLTQFLYTLVKFILLSNKDQLTQWYDIHNLVLSGQVLDHDPERFPTFTYFRMLTANYLCLFDFNGSEEAAKIVSLELMVDAAQGDVIVPRED